MIAVHRKRLHPIIADIMRKFATTALNELNNKTDTTEYQVLIPIEKMTVDTIIVAPQLLVTARALEEALLPPVRTNSGSLGSLHSPPL